MRFPRRSAAMVVLVTGLLSVGAATANAEPVVTTVAERPTPEGATPFTDNPSIVDGRVHAIDSWTRLPDDRAIAVHFTSGPPACYGVHAEVQETEDIVAVKLLSGVPPEAVGRVCTMIAVTGTLTVNIETPVGNRAVVSIT
jgi:hypothetical protein